MKAIGTIGERRT